MSRELLQQALDALRRVGEYGDIYRYKNTEQSPYTQIYEAIDAINVELAKPEPVQVTPHEFIAMASKQANMVGKPVVWAEYPTPHKIILDEGWEWGYEERAKEALAQPEQEPQIPTKIFAPNLEQILNAAGFYRRKWVGLTDEQLSKTYNELYTQYTRDDVNIADFILIARAIETKLKELNT